jgi:molecular chaperone GrpE
VRKGQYVHNGLVFGPEEREGVGRAGDRWQRDGGTAGMAGVAASETGGDRLEDADASIVEASAAHTSNPDASTAAASPVQEPPAETAAPRPAPAEADAQRALTELLDRYLRLAAEYDNYRKRSVRERQEAGPRAQGELVKGLMDSLDDLRRATAFDPATTNTARVIEGVQLIEKKLIKALSAAGLEVINPVDQAFNPELHEAISTEPALSPEDDHVVAQVYQPGYVFKGQLLRPARVVVKRWSG